MPDSRPDEVTGERKRLPIEEVTVGEVARGGRIAWAVGAALVFVAAAVVTLAAFRFESRSHAEQVYSAQAKQNDHYEIDAEVVKARLDMLDRRFDRFELNLFHIAERIGARQEPLIELAPAAQSTIKPTKGP